MNETSQTKGNLARLTTAEVSQVSGGILEKEGLYPRKPGDVDYLVYVDGVLMGTVYGRQVPVDPDVGSNRNPPIDPILNGQP